MKTKSNKNKSLKQTGGGFIGRALIYKPLAKWLVDIAIIAEKALVNKTQNNTSSTPTTTPTPSIKDIDQKELKELIETITTILDKIQIKEIIDIFKHNVPKTDEELNTLIDNELNQFITEPNIEKIKTIIINGIKKLKDSPCFGTISEGITISTQVEIDKIIAELKLLLLENNDYIRLELLKFQDIEKQYQELKGQIEAEIKAEETILNTKKETKLNTNPINSINPNPPPTPINNTNNSTKLDELKTKLDELKTKLDELTKNFKSLKKNNTTKTNNKNKKNNTTSIIIKKLNSIKENITNTFNVKKTDLNTLLGKDKTETETDKKETETDKKETEITQLDTLFKTFNDQITQIQTLYEKLIKDILELETQITTKINTMKTKVGDVVPTPVETAVLETPPPVLETPVVPAPEGTPAVIVLEQPNPTPSPNPNSNSSVVGGSHRLKYKKNKKYKSKKNNKSKKHNSKFIKYKKTHKNKTKTNTY